MCFYFGFLLLVIFDFLKSMQYSVLVLLLILVEIGCAAFIFFDKTWEDVSVVWQFFDSQNLHVCSSYCDNMYLFRKSPPTKLATST